MSAPQQSSLQVATDVAPTVVVFPPVHLVPGELIAHSGQVQGAVAAATSLVWLGVAGSAVDGALACRAARRAVLQGQTSCAFRRRGRGA